MAAPAGCFSVSMTVASMRSSVFPTSRGCLLRGLRALWLKFPLEYFSVAFLWLQTSHLRIWWWFRQSVKWNVWKHAFITSLYRLAEWSSTPMLQWHHSKIAAPLVLRRMSNKCQQAANANFITRWQNVLLICYWLNGWITFVFQSNIHKMRAKRKKKFKVYTWSDIFFCHMLPSFSVKNK